MLYAVELRPAARRSLREFPRSDVVRLVAAIESLSANPRPRGVKKLAGIDNLYRIRVGDYRVVYQIHDDRLVILVVRIGHRREVYR